MISFGDIDRKYIYSHSFLSLGPVQILRGHPIYCCSSFLRSLQQSNGPPASSEYYRCWPSVSRRILASEYSRLFRAATFKWQRCSQTRGKLLSLSCRPGVCNRIYFPVDAGSFFGLAFGQKPIIFATIEVTAAGTVRQVRKARHRRCRPPKPPQSAGTSGFPSSSSPLNWLPAPVARSWPNCLKCAQRKRRRQFRNLPDVLPAYNGKLERSRSKLRGVTAPAQFSGSFCNVYDTPKH